MEYIISTINLYRHINKNNRKAIDVILPHGWRDKKVCVQIAAAEFNKATTGLRSYAVNN